MTDIKMYLVGGAVRDGLLGLPTKDYDYTVVVPPHPTKVLPGAAIGYARMRQHLLDQGFKIFLETPEYFTIRAKFPKGHTNEKQTADFVLARKDGPYSDGRRPDYVFAGTLEDDLRRRDFTVNALAQDEDGNIIDLFDGQLDLSIGHLRAVGDAKERLLEDPLRAYRALRFCVTKDFALNPELKFAMRNVAVLDKMEENVSADRIREELYRAFAHDTIRTISLLAHDFPHLLGIMQRKGIWLEPTSKNAPGVKSPKAKELEFSCNGFQDRKTV